MQTPAAGRDASNSLAVASVGHLPNAPATRVPVNEHHVRRGARSAPHAGMPTTPKSTGVHIRIMTTARPTPLSMPAACNARAMRKTPTVS